MKEPIFVLVQFSYLGAGAVGLGLVLQAWVLVLLAYKYQWLKQYP
jgi:hypothetical protein